MLVDEYRINTEDTRGAEVLLILQVQDQLGIEFYPGQWFLEPGTVGSFRRCAVTRQIGEIQTSRDRQPQDEDELKVGRLRSADAGLWEEGR